ncbi:hypothetical protein N7492_002519 [Penicillium capsulatum]|uniref:Queuine tRNA-ribosyltransferase accessory subunit 2 n=1 Tax=Penicillium capsulatum TaxID=69766 RepID=A0A9W9II03_9EURO|nr:hypothetical protein N7492_002519 [Penicillium capsulatum]KAJ6122877.1 hypothetical protein N7512_005342 [Penicillium capsulatum]
MDQETSAAHGMTFSILDSAATILAPRVGSLALAGRKTISTPHYVPLTSRGAVSHIAHDVMRKNTEINSFYLGLEDFIEKKHPAPVYLTPVSNGQSPLRRFISAPDDIPLIFAPRRFPALPCPPVNTDTSIAIQTSVGFRQLSAHYYVDAIQKLKPDIAIGMADLVLGRPPGVKRRGKMVDRTHAFTRDALERLYGDHVPEEQRSKASYFAPVLPLENTQQSLYLGDLESEFRDHLSGLALYESSSLSSVPEDLGYLPRLLLSEPSNPQEVLREISLGADLLTVPFIGTASDAGIVLDFSFPVVSQDQNGSRPPLGINLWLPEYAKDVSPMRKGCACYACQHHHRAYINHLLSAKEMTAWVLLQQHNHHVMDRFFAGVRESIQRGSFEEDMQAFTRVYAPTLPERTGEGPRLRGYQLPAPGPNQPRRMPRIYGRLDEAKQKYAESLSSVATPDTDAEGLERHGFAEKA